MTVYKSSYTGPQIDAALATVAGSNLSTSHKITRAATFIIAAADSAAKSKAQADYVCDGTADDVQIQAAIDALPSTGGKIQLLEGTFNINSAIIIQDNNIAIQGCGNASKLQIVTAAAAAIVAGDEAAHEYQGIELKDFGIHTDVNSSYGIHFNRLVTHSIISGIYISGLRAEAIKFTSGNTASGCSWNIIENCSIATCYHDGISIGPGSNVCLVTGNRIHSQQSETGRYGIYTVGADTRIIGNLMFDVDYGIACDSANAATYAVIGNYIQNSQRTGIALFNGTHHGVVSNNVIMYPSDTFNNAFDGILLQGTNYTVVTGNVIRGFAGELNKPRHAIFMQTGEDAYGNIAEYNIIADNIAENCVGTEYELVALNNTAHDNI